MFSTLANVYPWTLLVVGAIAVALGIDRTLNRKSEENRLLRIAALVGGFLMLVLPTLIVLQGLSSAAVAPITLLLMAVLGLCLLARAMKAVPMTFLAVAAAGWGLLALSLQLKGSEVAGNAPMSVVAIAVLIVLGIVFAISFSVESAIDIFLGMVGAGLVVTAIGALAAAHGLLIGAGLTGPGGLLELG